MPKHKSAIRNPHSAMVCMLRVLVAAITLVLGSVALARAQDRVKPARRSVKRVEQKILQIEREIMAAIKDKDTGQLSRIVAEDFVHRSPAGPDLTKAEFLNLVKTIPVKILAVWGDQFAVHVYGQTAVLTGVQHARTVNDEGKEEISAGAFTDIFVRRNGRWLLVLAHTVDLPPPPEK